MLFGKKRRGLSPMDEQLEGDATITGEVYDVLDKLQKAGTQLTIRVRRNEAYTSELLGLGRDGFFIDTLSPPVGDRHAKPGKVIEVESILDGVSYNFHATVLGKVEFLDEMPAFKLAYPVDIRREQRRKNQRLPSHGLARISFIRPFDCEGEVSNIGDGGLAFEYPAELGRLRIGTRLGGARLDLRGFGFIDLKAEVVGSVVVRLGGLLLPASYRTGLRFFNLSENDKLKLADFLKTLES